MAETEVETPKAKTPKAEAVEEKSMPEAEPIVGKDMSGESEEGEKFDLKSWKTWIAIVLGLVVVGGVIYFLFF